MRIWKFGIVPLLCTLLIGFVPRAAAQTAEDECNHLVETVFDQAERDDVSQPEILLSIVTVARQARECYGERRRDNIVWLLNNEVFALDLLRRHDEARAAIDLFFDEYFADAPDLFKGKFFQWRLLYHLYAGRYEEAADDYRDARQYDVALTLAQRAVLRNDGAMLQIRSGDFEGAARRTTEGIALLDSTYRLRDEGVILAKLLHNRGHARLERYEEDSTAALLEPARLDLHVAIALRDSMGFSERQAEAYVTLGEIYHGLGDGPAGRGYMVRALALARDVGNTRGEIYALWHSGRMSRRGGMSRLARQQLQEALRLSEESGVGEYELFIQLELGRLFEDREAWRRAEDLYRAVAEAPDDTRYRSRLFDDAKARDEAERRSVAMRMHLRDAEVSRLYALLYVLALVALLFAGAFAWERQQRVELRRRHALLRNGIPEEDDLFERRRRYAYRVMMHPEDVLRALGDTGSSALLKAGLENNAQLFVCLCSLERRIDGRGVAARSMERFLRRHFFKRSWDWPETLDAWRAHFVKHPISS